jgi:hypothetical protein
MTTSGTQSRVVAPQCARKGARGQQSATRPGRRKEAQKWVFPLAVPGSKMAGSTSSGGAVPGGAAGAVERDVADGAGPRADTAVERTTPWARPEAAVGPKESLEGRGKATRLGLAALDLRAGARGGSRACGGGALPACLYLQGGRA